MDLLSRKMVDLQQWTLISGIEFTEISFLMRFSHWVLFIDRHMGGFRMMFCESGFGLVVRTAVLLGLANQPDVRPTGLASSVAYFRCICCTAKHRIGGRLRFNVKLLAPRVSARNFWLGRREPKSQRGVWRPSPRKILASDISRCD